MVLVSPMQSWASAGVGLPALFGLWWGERWLAPPICAPTSLLKACPGLPAPTRPAVGYLPPAPLLPRYSRASLAEAPAIFGLPPPPPRSHCPSLLPRHSGASRRPLSPPAAGRGPRSQQPGARRLLETMSGAWRRGNFAPGAGPCGAAEAAGFLHLFRFSW